MTVMLAVKPVGEPDVGDRHLRFDERGWETERCRMAQATAPILDSTECEVPGPLHEDRFRVRSGQKEQENNCSRDGLPMLPHRVRSVMKAGDPV